jgi:hypothetical protein
LADVHLFGQADSMDWNDENISLVYELSAQQVSREKFRNISFVNSILIGYFWM